MSSAKRKIVIVYPNLTAAEVSFLATAAHDRHEPLEARQSWIEEQVRAEELDITGLVSSYLCVELVGESIAKDLHEGEVADVLGLPLLQKWLDDPSCQKEPDWVGWHGPDVQSDCRSQGSFANKLVALFWYSITFYNSSSYYRVLRYGKPQPERRNLLLAFTWLFGKRAQLLEQWLTHERHGNVC